MRAKQSPLEAEVDPASEEYVSVLPTWAVCVVLLATMGPNWVFLWYATSTESLLRWTHGFGWFVGLLTVTLLAGWYLSVPKIVISAERVRFPRGVELRWEEVKGSRIVRFAGLRIIRIRSRSGEVASLLLTRRGGRELGERLMGLSGREASASTVGARPKRDH